jgi:hypothetical protein
MGEVRRGIKVQQGDDAVPDRAGRSMSSFSLRASFIRVQHYLGGPAQWPGPARGHRPTCVPSRPEPGRPT